MSFTLRLWPEICPIKGGSNCIFKDTFRTLTSHNDVMLQVHFYRFSVAWSRILPDGTVAGGVNEAGVNFYNTYAI